MDVEMRIYKTACPGEAVAGSIAGTITLGIGEFFRVNETTKGVVDKLGRKAIKRLNDFIFVFDDLERVEKKAFREVMGLINSLVADHDRRVILVADEKKLIEFLEGEGWKDQNEKIVGRRAGIEADFEGVIRASIENVTDDRSKVILRDKVSQLIEIAKISRVENLRNLSWAVHNAAAFVECLCSDDDIPASHVERTMSLVIAVTLWMRAGMLDTGSLNQLPGLLRTLAFRSATSRNQDNLLDPETEKAKRFSEVFASLSVDSPPIDYAFIEGFEASGVLNHSEVLLWVKSQFGFGRQYKEPAWRTLWYSHERPIAETEKAITELREELLARTYKDYGSILHAAGLAIRQLKVNDHRLTGGQDVFEFFREYIDDIAADGSLQKIKLDHFSMSFDSHSGLGFSSRETPEFAEILRYLRLKSQEVAIVELQERVESILRDAEAGDLEALFKFVGPDDYELSTSPILMNIPADRLATFMATDVPALDAGAKLIAYRYHNVRSGDPLLDEIQWARTVYIAVLAKLQEWNEPHRTMAVNSFTGLIRHYDQEKSLDSRIVS